MKAILICPSDRQNTGFVAHRLPLALLPILGRTALDRAMAYLARMGAKEIIVLASEMPVKIRAAVAGGKPWGVKAEVFSEPHELTVEQARAKYKTSGAVWLDEPVDVLRAESWPEVAGAKLWLCTTAWFQHLGEHMRAAAGDMVGMKELKPGVWVGSKSHISSTALLTAPCWIGHHAWIAAGAVVGPHAVVEEGACVDECAEVRHSFVAPLSYVGEFVELCNSLVCGGTVYNWKCGATAQVTDAFLLGDLSSSPSPRSTNLGARVLALFALMVSLPVFIFAVLHCVLFLRQKPLLRHRSVAAPHTSPDVPYLQTFIHYELNGVSGLWRRLPELWNIFRGDFHWVGNRPMTPEQARRLNNEFERLWLTVPTGVFALADVEDGGDESPDVAQAHAAYYASCHHFRLDLKILSKALLRLFTPVFPVSKQLSPTLP